MSNLIFPMRLRCVISCFLLLTTGIPAYGQQTLEVTRPADSTQTIPVHISGLTGQAASAVKFDLEIQGFDVVEEENAQYLVRGTSQGNVEGRLIHKGSGETLISKSYKGGSLRMQAHAFSDEIVLTTTGIGGIASTLIAFKADPGKAKEVYVSDYDGYNAVQVTQDNTIAAAPQWVPGQKQLVYTSYLRNNPDIYIHNLLTGERRIIARYSGSNISPSVSPDGKKVAMILSKEGSPDLFVANIDGSNLVQLTQTRESESSPCWSPDGTQICFVSRMSGRPALYTISPTGGPLRNIRTAGISNPTEPCWSPDGKTIAFTALMKGFNICTVPAEGGTAEVLVGGEDPSWAPNSRTLIFTSRRENKRVLSLLDVPTKRVKDVHQLSMSCSQPSWAR